ncbi:MULTISPECIES: ATP-binding protein [Frankia]|uniref:ATP-binding protein n=1 Tax=Frankia TaxID=1854 RepID=UPI000412BFAF|nr:MULTISPECIES: ATP-binding protein [Frankia]
MAVAHFPPTDAAVTDVRTSTVRTLTAWFVSRAAVSITEAVACELASNAVKASHPRDVVAIRLTAASGHVLVEVWDSSEVGPQLTSPDAFDEHGRGLTLVDALSTRWGWFRARTGGKVVWAQIPGGLRPTTAITAPVMPTRTPVAGPQPVEPVAYRTDQQTLRRVADALRALDPWQHPRRPEAVTSGQHLAAQRRKRGSGLRTVP